jgi:hypothetical protein
MKTRKKRTRQYKVAPLALATPRTSTDFIEEPELLFGGGNTHFDPKTGIPLYGPRSLGTPRHQHEVHIGFIGTSEAVDHAQQFYEKCCDGVDGDEKHAPFPGCTADRGFRCNLRLDANLVELITRHEHQDILGTKRSRERFEAMLWLLRQKMEILT